MSDPTIADVLKEVGNNVTRLSEELKTRSDALKSDAEKAFAEIKASGQITDELKAAVDKGLAETAQLGARLSELEQKALRRGTEKGALEAKTPGQLFIENDEVKAFCAKVPSKGQVRVAMPSISNAITTISTGGVLTEPMRVPGVVGLAERRMTIRDLITPGRTSQSAIQYVRQTGFTNNAAPVSEGTLKPESNITFDLVTRSVATIAHWIPASKQILDDAPMLQSFIDGQLRYGLAYVEEDQLLNGDGTGSNLHGIIPQATPYSQAFEPVSQTQIDTIRLALLQAELAEFPATGIVLNPIDWARIELTKDAEGRYIFAQPQNSATPMLWSRPVVSTQAMDQDDFLAGAFRLGAQLFDREDANVEVSTEDSDNFRRNLVTIRAEERLVLAVYRPEAFVFGDFTNTT